MRDYNAISPSAKGLLLMKGLTDIPFMADAVKIVFGSAPLARKQAINETYIKRLIHFEARYKSINRLLETLGGNNIMEISSGFSFRGLHLALHNDEISYVDTDLPGVIADKEGLITQLINEKELELSGNLMMVPMDVLDEVSVTKAIGLLPSGPVSLVNEGLLMYFDTAEKERMCGNLHKILSERGGYWATADIYIKKSNLNLPNDELNQFLQSHNVEENKFESYEQAEEFFHARGFKIIKKADSVIRELSSLHYLPVHILQELSAEASRIGRIRESWALGVI